MPIRFATVDDIPALIELGRQMIGHTRFATFAYEPLRVQAQLHAALTEGKSRYVCLLAFDSEDRLVGMLLAVLEQHIFSSQLTASVMIFLVLPEARMGGWGVRLLRAFEQWAKNRQVLEINFGVNSATEQDTVGRFARKMGFKKVGENFVKGLG